MFSLVLENAALQNPEAVLLVDDRQAQPRKAHRLFQQRMGTHQQMDLSGGKILQKRGAFP